VMATWRTAGMRLAFSVRSLCVRRASHRTVPSNWGPGEKGKGRSHLPNCYQERLESAAGTSSWCLLYLLKPAVRPERSWRRPTT
jgi:hypothetical protein